MDCADSFTKNADVACHTQLSGSDFHHDGQPNVTESDAEKLQKMSLTTFLAVFFLGLSVICPVSLGFVVVAPVITLIGTDLGNTLTISWIVSAFGIASAVAFTIAGSLSDIFGRRYIIISGQVVALVGAIACATAKSTTTVIAGSAVSGFASGLILTVYAGVQELCPRKYRGMGLAWVEACTLFPWGTLNVLLANEIAQHASWRWIYYIAIIYGAISMAGTIVLYFPPARPRHDEENTRLNQVKRLDYVGLLLYSSGLATTLLGLAWAGTTGHPWRSVSVIAPIVIGPAVLACCFVYDWFSVDPTRALFPFHLFQRFREYTVLLIVIFVAGLIYLSMTALLPQATLYIFSNDATQIGLIQLPNGMGQTVGAIILPSIIHKTKNIKMHIITALFIQTLFVGLYAYTLPSHKAAWMAFQFFGQGCFSWLTVCCLMNAGLHVHHSHLGIASGIIGSFRSAGGAVGNTIFPTILHTVRNQQLGPKITKAALANGFNKVHLPQLIPAVVNAAVGVPHAFAKVPGITPAIEAATATALKEAYAYAFKIVFCSTIPFGVIALLAAMAIKDASQQMNNHTDVTLTKDVLHHNTEKQIGDSEERDV